MLARSLFPTCLSPNQRITTFSGMGRNKKGRKALFCWLSICMIEFLNPKRFYTNRQYLTQWFQADTLCVTDNDFENVEQTRQLLAQHPNQNRILDITHNPFPDNKLSLKFTPILTNNFEFFYKPQEGTTFFPLFLWMYSLRNPLWWDTFCFDSGTNKTQGLMCLNNRPRPHRTQVWAEFNQRGIIDQCAFSFTEPVYYEKDQYSYPYPLTIAGEKFNLTRNDIGVGHAVYGDCAVNLITETATDLTYISEKTCKPFVACQIPILVGSTGINQFLTDIGLDMFSNVVPWTTWDHEPDHNLRIKKIMDFVESWIRSGTMLEDYGRLLPRVQANKQYFHSDQFRTLLLQQMSNLVPA